MKVLTEKELKDFLVAMCVNADDKDIVMSDDLDEIDAEALDDTDEDFDFDDDECESGCYTNIYRTKNFIVKQHLRIKHSYVEDDILVSYDTYYPRTKERDSMYEDLFEEKKNINGKRMPASAYVRRYIEA
ncbi:MAG: hypothetical protein J6Z36_04255 [Clostridia bacterium]|nr:hypothetical protein [Clostridia bacterium]